VDSDRTATPKRWTMHLVRDFMLVLGPISSLFDDATFGAHWFIFRAQPDLFRTGWFVESLATQTLVIYVIRTARAPWRSRPSRALVLSTVVALTVGVVLPLTPMAGHLAGRRHRRFRQRRAVERDQDAARSFLRPHAVYQGITHHSTHRLPPTMPDQCC
jgi:magnesium-transporting ATPase (P-type)